MKKITAIISIVLAFVLFMTVSANGDVPVSSVNAEETNVVESIESIESIENVESLVDYLNNSGSDLEFYCFDKMTNYYYEFISLFVDETAYIGGIADNGEEIFVVTASFKDGHIVDMSTTVNVYNGDKFENYHSLVKNMLNIYANQFNIDSNAYVNKFFEFDKYELNVYDNPEYCFEVENLIGMGVIFNEGKDTMFDGVSYYFSTSIEGVVNVYERGFFS